MATRKEIIFSARDTGVADTMAKLRNSANELGRDLIRDSRNFTTSGKEAVRYIEEQVKAMERRNKLDKEQARLVLDKEKSQGLASAKTPEDRREVQQEFQTGMAELDSDKRTDEMQISLLRELIETTKNTAREEISEDRKDVTKQIQADKSVAELGLAPDQDEVEALKKSIQRQELGDVYDSEGEEKNKFDVARGAKRVTDEGASALSKPNEIWAVAGTLAMIPFVGDGLSMLANKAMGEASQRMDARSSASGRMGGTASTGGANAYGMTEAEALGKYGGQFSGGVSRAGAVGGSLTSSIQRDLGNVGSEEAMKLEMGMGVNAGALDQLGGLLGYNSANIDPGKRSSVGGIMFDLITKSMSDTGLMGKDGQATGNLNPIISQTNQVLSSLTNTLESVSVPGALAGMSGLTSLGGSFADPERMGQRYMQVQQGLTDTSNPFAQAMKFSTMQGMGGKGKSRFEMMEMQEKGMTEPGYMKNYMKQLHEMSGGNKDVFLEEVKGAFSQLSFSQSRSLAEGYLEDPETFDVDPDALLKGKKSLDDRNFTNEMAVRTAEWSETFGDVGEKIIGGLTSVADKLEKLTSYL